MPSNVCSNCLLRVFKSNKYFANVNLPADNQAERVGIGELRLQVRRTPTSSLSHAQFASARTGH